MKEVAIGNSNLKTSAIALGVMRMLTLNSDDAASLLDTVHAQGVNFIDSADIYGSGKSEKVFGEALKKSGVKREDLIIQSKGGIILDPKRSHDDLVFGMRYDFSKDHLIESVDGILKRMQIDYLDFFLLHRPDPLMEPDEVAAAFDELQAAGKVRHFGVSNCNPSQVNLLQASIDQKLLVNQLQFSVMHAGTISSGLHVNMEDDAGVDHDGGIIEYSRLHNMTIQAWSPFQYGLFEGAYIDNPKFPELNKKLQELADAKDSTKNGIATAWILRHPAKMQVILGSMNKEHLTESIKGTDVQLTNQEWYDLYFAAGHDLP